MILAMPLLEIIFYVNRFNPWDLNYLCLFIYIFIYTHLWVVNR